MKSYVQHGNVLTFAAPYAVASGAPFKVGALVAIAVTAAAAAGVAVEGKTEGVFALPKVSAQAWAVGDKIYWDDAAKLMTNVAGGTLVGAATVAAVNPSATGTVYLDGAVR